MRTRFGLFCEGLFEGIWLITLIIAPLYFNFHTSTIFDLDKSSLIRSLALLMLIIYLIRLVEGKWSNLTKPSLDRSSIITHPIVITGLILGGCYLFSTIVSVTPHTSWWGSYSRAQGAYTLLAYVVIFFITALTLRKQIQLERMVTTIILTSFPIAIYGLCQPLRLDSLPWGTDFTKRIGSTIGNPIFLGAYFIMVIPLTLTRLIHSVSHLLRQGRTKLSRPLGRGSPSAHWGETRLRRLATYLLIAFYILLLLLQIGCLILTVSRGPFVGLMVGLFFFFVWTAILYQRKKLALITYGLAIILTAFLIVFNLPNTPIEPLKKIPYIGRLGQVFETESGSGKVRLLIWEGVTNMVKAGGIRNFIGLGPEMMAVLYYRHCPPQLVRFEGHIAFPDRSHNELFDTLISTGFIGTFVYLCFIGIIIFYILKWLGLVKNRFQTLLFIVLCVAGSLAGIILPRLLQGSFIFSAVGIPLGLVSAAAVYILIALFQPQDKLEHPTNIPGLILIGLASALIAHFIETQFGIALTATRSYFWLFAAMFVSTGYLIGTKTLSACVPADVGADRSESTQHVPPKEYSPSSAKSDDTLTPLTSYALIIGFILSTVFYNLVPSLTSPPFNLVIVGEIVLILLFSAIFITIIRTSTVSLPPRPVRAGGLKYYSTLLIFSAGYVIVFAMILSLFLPPFYFQPSSPIIHLGVIPVFYLWVLLTIVLLAWSVYPKEVIGESSKKKYRLKLIRSGNIIIYVFLIASIFIWIFYSLIKPLQGKMLDKIGANLKKHEHWDESLKYYQQAMDYSLNKTYYYAEIAGIFMEKWYRAANPEKKAQFREQCKEYLLRSIEYEPLSPVRNANLGRFYRKWALDSRDDKERKHHFQEAAKYYEQAHHLTPYNPRLLNEWGELYIDMKEYKKAMEKYEVSEKLDNTFAETYAHLGDVYTTINKMPEASKYYEQAAKLYLTSKERLRDPNQEILFTRTHQRLIEYQPKNYLGYYNLAHYYWRKRNYKRCLGLAKKGRDLAPPAQQKVLNQYIKRLERH